MIPPPDVVPQLTGKIGINVNALDFRKSPRCQFGVDLSKEGVLAPGLQKPWQDERRGTFPDPRTFRQDPTIVRAGDGVVAATAGASPDHRGRPRRPECLRRHLWSTFVGGCGSHAERRLPVPSCVNDEVVEVAVAVQIHGDRVGVIVVIVKRPPVFVFACQFRAMNPTPLPTRPTMARWNNSAWGSVRVHRGKADRLPLGVVSDSNMVVTS